MAVPPGARDVDPGAEAERLAKARASLPVCNWPVLLDEQHQVVYGDETQWVQIRVAVERPRPVPADLGTQLAKVIRANWPGPQRDDSADYADAAQ